MAIAFEDLFAGVSGLSLAETPLDLGHGVTIRSTYAYLFSSPMMAFKEAPPGKPSPGPWRPVHGGFSRSITSEIHVSASALPERTSPSDVAWSIVFALRLGIDPAVELTATSNRALTSEVGLDAPDVWINAVEVTPREFPLSIEGGALTSEKAKWVSSTWPTALRLISDHAEFALAVDAVMTGQYVQRPALTLVSLWAALEAIFSPATTELKFRVSSLVAAYLEPPGERRKRLAKDVARLYDKRSAAAHGKPSHETSHVLASFNLVRDVLIKILSEGRFPTKEHLENLLYGES